MRGQSRRDGKMYFLRLFNESKETNIMLRHLGNSKKKGVTYSINILVQTK